MMSIDVWNSKVLNLLPVPTVGRRYLPILVTVSWLSSYDSKTARKSIIEYIRLLYCLVMVVLSPGPGPAREGGS